MPIDDYPSIVTLEPHYYDELPPSYAVTKSPEFADGGCDHNLDADKKVRRWVLEYMIRTPAQLAALDAHMEAAKYSDEAGSAFGFGFTTLDDEYVENVHYAPGGFERSHTKQHSQRRRVQLIKYP